MSSHRRDTGTRNGRHDLAVIGAGSAGFSAAIAAAEQGAQVALIGHGMIGGTCVNVGCVPSKTMIRAAETVHQGKAARRFAGIAAQAAISDWRAVVAQKDELVTELRQAKYLDLLPAYDTVTYLDGPARFTGDGIAIDGNAVDADKIIIATGSRPAVPTIPGIEGVPYLTSTTALELQDLPKTLAIVGGGYIGCELAQLFARAGVAVTLLCRSRLLPEGEPEISEALAGFFRDEGITVLAGVAYENIARTDNGASLVVRTAIGEQTIEAARVLGTAGRIANVEGLGLAEAGIALPENCGIRVDDRMRTSRAGVYAAGDVTGRDQFVYMAAHGAKITAENALNGDGRRYDNAAMPAVVFTDPQVASVGMTEASARAAGLDVRTSLLPLEHVPRALAARDTRGLIKLVAEGDGKRLLGAHILAPEGADAIQTAAIAIKTGMRAEELGEMIFPYLTTVEGLKLAAQTFDKDVAKLSCCAG